MKRHTASIFTALLFAFAFLPVRNATAGGIIGAGVRRHSQHSVFKELPFDDGDLSYGIAYEHHDQNAYWQLAVAYAPQPGTNGVDFVVTPQINLIVKDRIWRAGIGVLDSYIEMEDGESDWSDVYFQFLTGIHLPVFGGQFDILAYYPFGEWGDIGDFDFDDLDYGAWLTFSF